MTKAFGYALRTIREAAGLSLPGLARAARYSESHLRSVENGNRKCTVDVAKACDAALDAGGLLTELATAERDDDEMKRRTILRALGVLAVSGDKIGLGSSHVTEALDIVLSNDADSIDVASASIAELVNHYSHSVATASPAGIYEELLGVRSHAGSLLDRPTRSWRGHPDLVLGIGWLSNLLAVVTSYMGNHTAALVWCADAERRGRELGHPELAGWAALTKAAIAYYHGHAEKSMALANRGLSRTSFGTVVHAKLAAQEMRALALLGDKSGVAVAKRRAAGAMEAIPPDVHNSGVFSIPFSDDPQYTATSLLLVKKYSEAVSTTARVIRTAYSGQQHAHRVQSSSYARTLLILALGHAGLGNAEEAAAAGHAALDSAGLVWPTLVLAGKLDSALSRNFAAARETSDFRAHYLEAATSIRGSTNREGNR